MNDYPPPGPELDAVVAEKVMGWVRYTAGPLVVCRPPGDRLSVHLKGWRLPHYSTDISDAFEVLEKIGRGWIGEIGDGRWCSAFRSEDYVMGLHGDGARFAVRGWMAEADEETPAHAICVAALKAMEKP